jgi:hypothetical protein
VFDPNWFFREEGWAYWKGPADGDGLRGKEEHDYRSRRLKGIDALNIEWVQVCRPNETSINGEVRLGRLKKAGHIRLDAKMFATLHDNWFRLPLRLLDQLIGGKWLTFDGTILRDPLGRRVVLAMCWEPDHVKWCARTLMSSDFDRDDLSAVLPPDTM